jgi:hypothetical protein
MTEKYRRACILYNEDPDKMEPFEFFAAFDKFMTNYNVSGLAWDWSRVSSQPNGVGDGGIRGAQKAKEDLRRIERADARDAAQRANGSVLPVTHMRNDDIELPNHPVLGVRSKHL